MKTFFSIFWLIAAVILIWFSVDCFYGYFYPQKYTQEINKYAQEFQVSPSLVAAVINVESGYNVDKVSSKGAVGLMQILPPTAEWIAERLGQKFDERNLYVPDKNIEYGAFYLSYLEKYFGDTRLALCAYNAGMGNVKAWLKNEEYSTDGELKIIPFQETANYVNKVNNNIWHYSRQKVYCQ